MTGVAPQSFDISISFRLLAKLIPPVFKSMEQAVHTPAVQAIAVHSITRISK